jgi:membrane-bound lytic murein transglycosylase
MSFSGVMMMTVVQMVTNVWCIRWYAKKHPAEAKEMFWKWASYLRK